MDLNILAQTLNKMVVKQAELIEGLNLQITSQAKYIQSLNELIKLLQAENTVQKTALNNSNSVK